MAHAATIRRAGAEDRLAMQTEWFGVALFALACTIFYIAGGQAQSRLDGWFPLADSFLHGRLSILPDRPWIEMATTGNGLWYLPFPPIPAVVLVPFVALFGVDVADTSGATGLVGGINVVLIWILMRQMGLSVRKSAWLTASFALGSEAMYISWTGGVHHWSATLGLMFALMALILAVRNQWPLASGVLLLLAAGCRPTFLLALFAYFVIYAYPRVRRPDAETWRRAIRPIFLFCAGALPIGLLLLWYNYARFGSPFEFGYSKIVSATNGDSVLSEFWYRDGIVSVWYLARGLFTFLLRGFNFSETPPWIQPSWAGTAVTFTMPVLVYLFKARRPDPWIVAGWIGILFPLVVDLAHGNPGYQQFGYRFFLDSFPFVWFLLAIVAREHGLTKGMQAAIVAGGAVNGYALWCIATGFMTR